MPPPVFITRNIPEVGLMVLRRAGRAVEVNPEDRSLTPAELRAAVRGRTGVLCMLTDRIDAAVLDAAAGCRVVANYAVGYDNIDVPAATTRGIVVTNTPGALTDATSDLAWTLLVSAARRVAEADAFTRAGRFQGWAPMLFLGADLTGRTLGIVGAGRIGAAVALKSVGFRMRVLYADPSHHPTLDKELGARRVPLDELLRESDFVSLHVPLTAETRHLIGAAQLAMMKQTAVLVNTARGPVIDEAALVAALKAGTIAAAGLDVYEDEPRLAPGLADLPNVVLLPHLGSATLETRARMAAMAAENLLAVLAGRRPPNCVNPEVYDAQR
jgi:glyoxylate reductase